MTSSLLMHNIGTLATPLGIGPRAGKEQGEILRLHNAYILIENGCIAQIGTGIGPKAKKEVDAGGRLVTPGLIDSHTHLILEVGEPMSFL